MNWQRRARWGLVLFAVVFVGVIIVSLRPRPSTTEIATEREDPRAIVESGPGQTVSTAGADEDFNLTYKRMFQYTDGTMRFLEIEVELPPRGGRVMTLSGDEAITEDPAGEGRPRATRASAPSGGAERQTLVRGNVRLTSNDGFEARAAEATYRQPDEVVQVPGEVTFTRGRMSGRSQGARYDIGRDRLSLLHAPRIEIAPDAQGEEASEITANAAEVAQGERYIQLVDDVRMTRGGQVTEAANSMLFLQPDADILERVELRGRARIVTEDAAPGALQSMSARAIDLEYAPDGQTVRDAALTGDGAVQMAADGGGPGRRLRGDTLSLAFAPDGTTMTQLIARERVQVDLPAAGSTPAREIRSATLDAAGPETGIDQARFDGGVEYRELQAVGQGDAADDRVVTAQTLETRTQPGFGDIERATFTGKAVLNEGPRREGSAEQVDYLVAERRATLSSPGTRGVGARVSDQRAAVDAETIDLSLDDDALVATGGVRSVLKARTGEEDARDRPVIFRDEEPVNVTADRLASRDSVGVYTGTARLWQGTTAITAETLTLEEESGNLTGDGNVVSTLALAANAEEDRADAGNTPPTTIRAEHLEYDEAERRAIYSGGQPHLIGPEGDLQAQRITLYLDEEGASLERLEGEREVSLETTITHEGADVPRRATGSHLTYYAAEQRYVMRGGLVLVREQLPAECRETLGTVLTFYRSTDTIKVDASAGKRPQTVSGGKCPERRPED